jgi:hypothetical protein
VTLYGYRAEEVEYLFQAVFKPMAFSDADRKWMQEFLLKEHQAKSRDHKQHLAALQRRFTMLKSHIDVAYEDKLTGDLPEDDWREKNDRWQRERTEIKAEIDAIVTDEQEYIETGVQLIELAQRSESVYEKASTDIKRKLVETVSSNHVLKDGTLRFKYKKPFDLLSRTASKEIWWT